MVAPGDLDRGELIRIGEDVITIGGVATGVVVFVVACVLSTLIGRVFKRIRHRGLHDTSSVYVLEKVSTYGLVIIGLIAGLSTAGLDLSSFSVFAGALGLGVGLGLQGVVKEFVSGLFLIFDPTVSVGDYVEVENGERGIIVEIGPRATRLRTNDNINILIPNSHLIERPLINTTLRGDTRRIHIPFRVEPGAQRTLVRDVVLKAVKASPFTLPETEARRSQVWLIGYDEQSVDFELVVWPTKEAVKRPASMHAAYMWTIVDALEGAGVRLPSPQIDVRLQRGDAALAALGVEQEPEPPPRKVRRAPAVNDAAEDVMSPPDPEVVQAEAHSSRPEVPPGGAPPAPPPD
ncbi:mechanosensitive ion channel family protein [Brevundimonas lenta]|uniref:Small-conductance mechanosensitive channel n=1 Tax=Brevundimonas lenta TaxID=424796 RepID=A0A7W6JBV9_9CAUL|nr:mechanosensitive ion channel domain-containing protein [Brevundimonas lenta]MBB4082181.1 small-conductance mechanosensitive channel [Brevundimonas lenta]